VACKIAVGVSLVFYAGHWHNQELDSQEDDENRPKASKNKEFERHASVSQLTNIERYTVYKGRVVG
jgi:hypothetical protein